MTAKSIDQAVSSMPLSQPSPPQRVGSDPRNDPPANKPLPDPLRKACGINQPWRGGGK